MGQKTSFIKTFQPMARLLFYKSLPFLGWILSSSTPKKGKSQRNNWVSSGNLIKFRLTKINSKQSTKSTWPIETKKPF